MESRIAGERGSLSLRGRLLVLVAAFTMLMGATFGIVAQDRTALAGFNGQQVGINYCWTTDLITIKGINQNNQWTVWNGRPSNAGAVRTNGWFWKENVFIYRNGRYVKTIWVEPNQGPFNNWSYTDYC